MIDMDLKFRRHGWAIVLLLLIFAALLCFGDSRITSYTVSNGNFEPSDTGTDITNDVYLFDDTLIHEIIVDMDSDDYALMIRTYMETGLKEYFPANVTIDGVVLDHVGVRLKGQLTLNSALGRQGGNNGPASNVGMSEASNYTDVQLPLLIKIDEYVEGQTYQGYSKIALRMGNGAALLTEPLSYYAHRTLGQVVPETGHASVVMPGGRFLYGICEVLDEEYIDKHFPETDGVLYKAGNFVNFAYVGDDPTLYAESFSQETNKNDADLKQLIDFLKFVNESSDKEFESELPNRLDIDAFVTMMALDDLLGNQDSFSGMNSNYYLYYNPVTGQMTILSWDMNLAMVSVGLGNMGPEGVLPTVAERMWGDMEMPFNVSQNNHPMIGNPPAFDGDAGMVPGGFNRTRGPMPDGGFPDGRDRERQGANQLKDRFFANERFTQIYQERHAELANQIYCNGLLESKANELATVFSEYNMQEGIMPQDEYWISVNNTLSYIERQVDIYCQ